MNKKIIRSAVAFLTLIITILSSVQAYPAETDRRGSSQMPPAYSTADAFQQQMPEPDRYYISLRWLVYMLILSLPIAPSQPPAPSQNSIFVPQIQPPQTTLPRITDL